MALAAVSQTGSRTGSQVEGAEGEWEAGWSSKWGCDLLLCSYCEDGFMHCSRAGAPGSLQPEVVLSSPLSHRSEYRPLLCPDWVCSCAPLPGLDVPLHVHIPITKAGRVLLCVGGRLNCPPAGPGTWLF